MKNQQLAYHEAQIMKIRGQLQAGISPINDIKKPYGMRSVVFDRRIERLIRHERDFERKFEAGLLKWFNSAYKV